MASDKSAAKARKSIFITGGASGIGLATAKYFAAKGWFVGLGDVDETGMAMAVHAIGADNCAAFKLDVRDRQAWTDALDGFSKLTGGRMDALLNNAGIAKSGWFEEVDHDDADRVLDINIKGVVNGAYAGLELLKATPGSKLLNVASCAGIYGAPRLAVYSATKFAVRGLSEALDIEFGRYGIGVRCIMPWFIDTPILQSGALEGSNESMKSTLEGAGVPVYSVDEASKTIWDAVHGNKLYYTVGKRAGQLFFGVRFLPGVVRGQMKKQLLNL